MRGGALYSATSTHALYSSQPVGHVPVLDGATFHGDFLNGHMHGEGTYTNAEGDSFTGHWWMGETERFSLFIMCMSC